MSTPVVTGTIALMLQANPALTPNAVKAILQYTARDSSDYDYLTEGAGFVNAEGAVELARHLPRRSTCPTRPAGLVEADSSGATLLSRGRLTPAPMPGGSTWPGARPPRLAAPSSSGASSRTTRRAPGELPARISSARRSSGESGTGRTRCGARHAMAWTVPRRGPLPRAARSPTQVRRRSSGAAPSCGAARWSGATSEARATPSSGAHRRRHRRLGLGLHGRELLTSSGIRDRTKPVEQAVHGLRRRPRVPWRALPRAAQSYVSATIAAGAIAPSR